MRRICRDVRSHAANQRRIHGPAAARSQERVVGGTAVLGCAPTPAEAQPTENSPQTVSPAAVRNGNLEKAMVPILDTLRGTRVSAGGASAFLDKFGRSNAIPFNRERPAPKETGARRRAERDGQYVMASLSIALDSCDG